MTSFEKKQGYDIFRLGVWAGSDYADHSKNSIFWSMPFDAQKKLQDQNPSLKDAWDNYLCLLALTSENK